MNRSPVSNQISIQNVYHMARAKLPAGLVFAQCKSARLSVLEICTLEQGLQIHARLLPAPAVVYTC